MAPEPLYLTAEPFPAEGEPDLDLARPFVAADVVARYHQFCGRDVHFVAVCLEGGRRAAREPGATPHGLADQWAERLQATLDALDVTTDDFIRTSETRHQRVVKAFFLKLFDQGDIYKGTREGRYCPRCEDFAPADAEDRCPGCGEPLADAAHDAYFLRTSRYQKAVAEHLAGRPGLLVPAERRPALLRALAETGIPDPCISGARHEGAIDVPIDPAQAVEAWLDALIGHLTACGYLAEPQMFERYWPPRVQIVAPESVRTYALIWPAVLAAAGLSLPERLVVRGRLRLADGEPTAPAALAAQFGGDPVRYAVLLSADFTADGSLTLQGIADLCAADLRGRLERLVETTLAAIEEGRDGRVPRPGPLGPAEEPLVEASAGLFAEAGRLIDAFDFRAALGQVWGLVDEALRYAGEAGVSQAGAEGRAARQLDTALYVLAEVCRLVAHSLHPFLPRTAAAIRNRLGVASEGQKAVSQAQWGLTQPQARVQRGEPLFRGHAAPTG